MSSKTGRFQFGIGLIELMIALTLGLMITLATTSLFVQNKAAYSQTERFARMQESGRYALDLLARDLALLDFWGGIGFGDDIVDPGAGAIPLGADCGPADVRWAFNASQAIEYFRPTSLADSPTARFQCLQNGDGYSYKGGANVLALKHVAGTCVSTQKNSNGSYVCPVQKGDAGHVYVRTTGLAGTLVLSDGGSPPDPLLKDWEYLVHVYYIANDTRTGVPSLRRKYLTRNGGVPTTEDEGELVEGVEFFHVQFGIDTELDGVPNYYLSSPSTAQLLQAVSARVHVLVRSLEPDPTSPADDKIYQLGDLNVNQVLNGGAAFGDRFLRRVYTTTVQLRNPQYQILLDAGGRL